MLVFAQSNWLDKQYNIVNTCTLIIHMHTIGQRASLSLMNVHVYDFVKKISLPVCLSSYANNNNRIIE